MNSFIETLNQWGGRFPGFAWPMFWQSSLLITILFALNGLLRRRLRASIRYALWLVVLVKLCVPPTLALPTNPAWWIHQPPPPVVAKPKLQHYTVTYDQGPLPELPPAALPVIEPPKPAMTRLAWLLVGCASGSAILLGWMLGRWWQIVRLVRRAAASERLTALADEARQAIGMKGGVPVKLTSNTMSPAVCGLFRPVILIPQVLAEEFTDEQLRAVLLHELTHLRRRDVWLNFLQTLLQIGYWWHPLVWLANARIRRVREEAVDDAVMLALREEAETYAPTLLEVAKLALNRPLATLGLVGILESRSALRQRIERLVDFHPPRQAGLTLVSVLGILAFTAVAVPMGEGPAPLEKPTVLVGDTKEISFMPSVTFLLSYPISTDEMKHKLAEAGVIAPPTVFLYLNNGRLFVRGSKDQLTRVDRLVLQLNGYSDKEVESAVRQFSKRPDLEVISDSRTNLFSRTFKIDAQSLSNALKWVAGPSTNGITAMARSLFGQLGVDWESPKGKSIFYSDKFGKLFVKAPHSDLDVIERVVQALIQPNDKLSTSVDATMVGIAGATANDAERLVQAGKVHFEMGNLAEAKAKWSQALMVDSNNATAKYFLGLVQADYDRLAESLLQGGMTNQFKSAQQNAESKPPTSQIIQQGKRMYEQGHLELAERLLKLGLALDPDNADAKYYLGLVQSEKQKAKNINPAEGRQRIIQNLQTIRLERVEFNSVRLTDVLRDLSQQARTNDPEKKGLNFVINPNPDKTGPPVAALAIDPATGLPLPQTTESSSTEVVDLGSFVIKIPRLNDVTLGEVLDAVVKGASEPIHYSIQDFAVVFSPGILPQPLYARTFRVDMDLCVNALRKGTGMQTNSVPVMARSYFSALGVDWESPKGKTIYYNDTRGQLYVKAAASDLDTIERAIEALNGGSSDTTNAENADSMTMTFGVDQRVRAEELKKNLLAAGVKIPPTVFFYNVNGSGTFLVRGSKEQLSLVNQVALKLNGYSTNEIAADNKSFMQSVGSLPSRRTGETPTNLFSRTFKLDGIVFIRSLQEHTGLQTTNVSLLARTFFSKLGVDLEHPPGKSVFYNARSGTLFVKATIADLDLIERAVQVLTATPPQIHIKARFVEVPKGTVNGMKMLLTKTNFSGGGLTGILSHTNAQAILRVLQSRADVDFLAEPEMTTTSGRQAQMRATTTQDVIAGVSVEQQVDMPGVVMTNVVSLKTEKVETGPVLDVVSYVLSDGYTINLAVTPSFTEFLGYENATDTTGAASRSSGQIDLPQILPSIRKQKISATINLWDGQTVILGGMSKKKVPVVGDIPMLNSQHTAESEILVFITATIVDPAGNRVRNEKDDYFDKMGIPPQPVAK